MSFNDCKISESEIQTTGVQAQADTLTGSAADNKMVFDALPTLVIQKLNSLIDQMQQQAAAGQIGVTPFDGMTAQTLQDALEQIHADIGGNYGGADGAGKVGYTPSEGVDEDTVQAAIEAVQANLTAYIAKIKAATGAAEVGNAPIVGMTATNVQQALEELRKNIDNIVSGIIPGGSITSDMLQDGAVTADKLGSDVTGDTIPTSASDPTSISSQLSNLAGEKYTRIVSPPQSWAEVWALAPHVVYSWVQQTPLAWQPEDTPSGALRVELTIHNVASGTPSASRSAMLAYIDGATTLTRYVGEEMGTGASNGRWAKLATATSPQEFDLPLAEGYTQNNGCKYSKDQFNVVRVTFNLSKSAGTIAGGEVVATLPAGFRPKRYWACVAIGNNIPSDAATRHPVVVQVATNGEISASMMVETDQAELRAIVCAMEFLAAD